MAQLPLFERLREMIEAIDLCWQNGYFIPGLILLYSAIDQVAWLAEADEKTKVRDRFQQWVDKWMIPAGQLPCTSTELYAARCGLVHTLSSESEISKSKGARRLAYSYNHSTVELLQSELTASHPSQLVAVRIEDLRTSFLGGLSNFVEFCTQNQEEMLRITTKSMKYYSHIRGDFPEPRKPGKG